jgi:hypothetical protein
LNEQEQIEVPVEEKKKKHKFKKPKKDSSTNHLAASTNDPLEVSAEM